MALQNQVSAEVNRACIGKTMEVLVEAPSKRNALEYKGKTANLKTVIFPIGESRIGDFVLVKIESASSATLKGQIL